MKKLYVLLLFGHLLLVGCAGLFSTKNDLPSDENGILIFSLNKENSDNRYLKIDSPADEEKIKKDLIGFFREFADGHRLNELVLLRSFSLSNSYVDDETDSSLYESFSMKKNHRSIRDIFGSFQR